MISLPFLSAASHEPDVVKERLCAIREFPAFPTLLRDRLTVANDAELPVGPRHKMGGVARSKFGGAQVRKNVVGNHDGQAIMQRACQHGKQ